MNVAGTAVRIDLTLQDDAGDPQNLTGATMTWRLTRAYSVPHVVNKTSSSGITVDDAGNGSCYVDLDAPDTLDLQGTYYHEIKADYGSGNEKTWQLGTISFQESSVASTA